MFKHTHRHTDTHTHTHKHINAYSDKSERVSDIVFRVLRKQRAEHKEKIKRKYLKYKQSIYRKLEKNQKRIHIFVFYCSYAAFNVCVFQIPPKTNKNCFKLIRFKEINVNTLYKKTENI